MHNAQTMRNDIGICLLLRWWCEKCLIIPQHPFIYPSIHPFSQPTTQTPNHLCGLERNICLMHANELMRTRKCAHTALSEYRLLTQQHHRKSHISKHQSTAFGMFSIYPAFYLCTLCKASIIGPHRPNERERLTTLPRTTHT